MPQKKKTPKRASKKSARARKPSTHVKASSGTPAPLDPIQAALARRRAALLRR